MAFCTLGPIWSRNARLARWGRSTPFPHAYRENQPIFQNKGFPCNQRWIMCRWTLQDRWAPPEHPRDTSHGFSARCLRLPIRPVVRATSHAPGMHAPCMLRHAAAAIPPISQPMHCASVTGRAHTLAIWVAFGGVAGDSSRRDLPSGLLLAPLRACQVHRFPPGGPRALRVLPHCCHFVWGA